MTLPKDPFILLSFVNTKLRDEYASLNDLCNFNQLDQAQIETTLSSIAYVYHKEHNRFIAR